MWMVDKVSGMLMCGVWTDFHNAVRKIPMCGVQNVLQDVVSKTNAWNLCDVSQDVVRFSVFECL